jgi:hypothetical protein
MILVKVRGIAIRLPDEVGAGTEEAVWELRGVSAAVQGAKLREARTASRKSPAAAV